MPSSGKLLDLAGGLTTTAQIQRASIERIDERKTRTVDQFALDYDGLKLKIKDGDLVSVFASDLRKLADEINWDYAGDRAGNSHGHRRLA